MITVKINLEVDTRSFDFIKDKSRLVDYIRRELTSCLGVSNEVAEKFKISAKEKS